MVEWTRTHVQSARTIAVTRNIETTKDQVTDKNIKSIYTQIVVSPSHTWYFFTFYFFSDTGKENSYKKIKYIIKYIKIKYIIEIYIEKL